MITFTSQIDGKLSKTALNTIDGLSYSVLMKLLRNKDVKVNGVRVKTDIALKIGDLVEIYYNLPDRQSYDIKYVDDNVLVVYKYSGFTSETVFDAVKKEYASAGFIHRLDRNTDGIMIFSLNQKAETELLKGFKNKTFTKIYHAEVVGFLQKPSDVMQAYLVKDSENSLVKIFDKKVDGAVVIKTAYKTIKNLPIARWLKFNYLRVKPTKLGLILHILAIQSWGIASTETTNIIRRIRLNLKSLLQKN